MESSSSSPSRGRDYRHRHWQGGVTQSWGVGRACQLSIRWSRHLHWTNGRPVVKAVPLFPHPRQHSPVAGEKDNRPVRPLFRKSKVPFFERDGTVVQDFSTKSWKLNVGWHGRRRRRLAVELSTRKERAFFLSCSLSISLLADVQNIKWEREIKREREGECVQWSQADVLSRQPINLPWVNFESLLSLTDKGPFYSRHQRLKSRSVSRFHCSQLWSWLDRSQCLSVLLCSAGLEVLNPA